MPAMKFTIRRMFESDIEIALTLIRPQNWNQLEADWQRFLALEPEGCFVAVADGEVIGTTTTELFDAVGWIGMVTVSPDMRGRGIGRALVACAIQYLRSIGARTIKLDATPMGKPLYDRLGFKAEYAIHRYSGIPVSGGISRNIVPYQYDLGILQAMHNLDRKAYHVDRSEMINRLVSGWPELTAVHETLGEIDGYIVGRHGFHYEHLGPVVALNPVAAENLLLWGSGQSQGKRIAFDCPDPNLAGVELASRLGLDAAREFTRMHLGTEPFLDNPQVIYATSGAEKG